MTDAGKPSSAGKPPTREPWPMSWVAGAILVFIAGYTIVNVLYRKDAPAHEPWAEAQARAEQPIVPLMHGWTWLRATLVPPRMDEPAVAATEPASVTRGEPPADLAAHLPRDLVLLMPSKPALHPGPMHIVPPASHQAPEPLLIRIHVPADVAVPAFGQTLAFAQDHQLWIFLQDASRTPRGFEPVRPAATLSLELPAGAFEPGVWNVSLYHGAAIVSWRFEVQEPVAPPLTTDR